MAINKEDFRLNSKPKVNRFGEAIIQKKKRQGTAGAVASAYEVNPYAYNQMPQRQTRISRKMRVKTPQVNSSKNPRNSGPNAQLISGSGEKQIRPTTAVGVSKLESNDFAPNKARRFLGSAKPGNRRLIGGKKILNAFDRNIDEEFVDRPPSRQKEPSLALGIDSDYGDEDDEDNPSNKISTEIILTTGIPAPSNEYPIKYTPSQGKRGAAVDLRTQNRHKTPTKLSAFDERPKSPHVDGRRDTLSYEDHENFATNDIKNHEIRRKTNALKGMRGAEIPFTVTTAKTHKERNRQTKEINLIEEWEHKDGNYKGCPWFFESSKREENHKDDSFTWVDFQRVYEMDGIIPQDDISHLLDEDDESKQT